MTNKKTPGTLKSNRRATRYEYRGHCTVASASQSCSAHLINLSENGALIAVLDEHTLKVGERIRLNVVQPGGANISVRGSIVHLKEHFSGLEFAPETESDQGLLRGFLEQTGVIDKDD